MNWILIVLVLHTGGLAAMTSATFETSEACEAAAAQWRKDFKGNDPRHGVKALCHAAR